MKCQGVPPGQIECMNPKSPDVRSEATHRVTFSDKQTNMMCETCALRLKQVIGPTLKVEKIGAKTP